MSYHKIFRRAPLTLLLVGLLSPSVAHSQDKPLAVPKYVRQSTDEFTGHTYNSVPVTLDCESYASIELLLQYFVPAKPEESPSYQIFVNYSDRDWMFIEDGNSMIMLLAGRRVELPTAGSAGAAGKRSVGRGAVYERAMYDNIAPNLFSEIAAAYPVRLRIKGSERDVDCSLPDEARKRLQTFNDLFVVAKK